MKLEKILILGSGALRIGQAGEFDYSGSQAIKAVKEEGIATVLINPNIATIQTDEGMADQVYFLPVEPRFVEEIIKKEKVDAILLSFGGQTALNCGLELEETGVLKKYGVRVLGTPVSTIRDTEDRHLFAQRLAEISVSTAKSKAVYSAQEAVSAAEEIGFPVMMRSGFSLGGKGSSIVNNKEECRQLAEIVFSSVSQILVEECLKGWKEVEYEVVRDGNDNCITVCNMENFDPMGVHTGESIVVAPSQTLDDFEYQLLRDVAIKTIRHLGIVGECNIQYALDPCSRQYRVIEVNARLSRSSALASKATGYPLAYVAAKIALGYLLPEIPNAITKKTTAFFEPALDYIVCKFPRWDLDKFDVVDKQIGTEMKSVGEVMAIGRSFAEVIQKATRMLEIGLDGLDTSKYEFADIREAIRVPTPRRLFAVAEGIKQGITLEEIREISGIDMFFLYEIKRIVGLEKKIEALDSVNAVDATFMREIKTAGFSDKMIGRLLKESEANVRGKRHELGVRPHLSQIDTLAAEYPAETNFLYFTYAAIKSDVVPSLDKSIMVLGSGCYRIGASVEFDWCAVSAVAAARELGYQTIMLNYNPETVSTDYDICEKLVFDEITLETVLELYDFEKPMGLIVSMGGQTPNNLALKLANEGINILGTSPEAIDKAEDRHKFSSLLDAIGIQQPKWIESKSTNELEHDVASIGGFPVLVRPSYVLSGAAMRVAYSAEELKAFLKKAVSISSEHPVIISKYECNAKEIEFDAVAKQGQVVLYAITEHIENAGVHSGDATLMFPTQTLSPEVVDKVRLIGYQLAKYLTITGPFNVQMLERNNQVRVIECNLRASRSFPFVSKAMGVNFIHYATRLMLGAEKLPAYNRRGKEHCYVVIKSPQFSFSRLKGVDPRLGVEMSSTGEVACFGRDREEALLSAMIATGFKIPRHAVFIALEVDSHRSNFIKEAKLLKQLGLELYTCLETTVILEKNNIACTAINVSQLIETNQDKLVEFLKSRGIDMIVSVPEIACLNVSREGYYLRRMAVDLEISLVTDICLAKSAIAAISKYQMRDIDIKSWKEYLHTVTDPSRLVTEAVTL